MKNASFWTTYVVAALVVPLGALAILAQDNGADEGRLSGVVRDTFNHAIPGVKVSAVDTVRDFRREATTNASGLYVLGNLPRGTYRIHAELPGFQTVIHIQTIEGLPLDLNFFLSPTGIRQGAFEPAGPHVTGTVRDFAYVSLPGVRLTFVNAIAESTEQAVTDDRGNYSLSDLRPGTFDVVAEKAGFETLRLKDIKLANGITTQLHLKLRKP